MINAVDELRKFVKTQFKVIFLGSGKNEYKQYLKSLIKEKKLKIILFLRTEQNILKPF